jgi:outer membrane protein
MKYLFSSLLICGLILFCTTVNAQSELTLKEAISIGLENNYSIRIAKNTEEITKLNATPGAAGFLPIVGINANKSFSIDDVEQQFINDAAPRRIDNAKTNNLAINPSLQWTIFDGLGMFVALERLNELEAEGLENTKIAVENTMASISNSFYLIALEEARLKVLKTTMEISKERLTISKDKYELGKASKLEYLAAQVDYNADSTALINQDVVIFISKANLNELLGRDASIDFSVAFEINVTEDLKLEELVNTLNLKNPQLLAAQRRKNVSYLQVKEIQAERMPVLTLNGGYNYSVRNSDAGFLISNRGSGFTYGASAFLNVFNGNSVNRRTQIARVQSLNAELEVDQLRLQLESDIKRAFTTHQKNIILMNLENANQDIAKENAEIALERYRLGVSNSLELREAQVNSVDAETRALVAAFNAKASEIELLRLSGEIIQYAQQ